MLSKAIAIFKWCLYIAILMYDMNIYDCGLKWAYLMLTENGNILDFPIFTVHLTAAPITLICPVTSNWTQILWFTAVGFLLLLPDEINVHLYCYSENKNKGIGNLVSIWKLLKSLVHLLGKCHHVLHIVSEINWLKVYYVTFQLQSLPFLCTALQCD